MYTYEMTDVISITETDKGTGESVSEREERDSCRTDPSGDVLR